MVKRPGNCVSGERPWINPIGGYGDMLMVSGVLKLVSDRQPEKQFNLLRRTIYPNILKGHPAIAEIGFPPKGAKILRVDYWCMEEIGPGKQRPFQILARAFGLATPIEERLYLPGKVEEDPLLHKTIPWRKKNILIAPSSDSPRKTMDPAIWERLVGYLSDDGALVMQVGRLREQHIRNAYSLLGLTTPRQLVALMRKCDLVITMDNFIMHTAHLVGKRAVAIWGPTHHQIYGYPGQIHLQVPRRCDLEGLEGCLGPSNNASGKLYGTPCPLEEGHCLNQTDPQIVYEYARRELI